MQGHYGVNEAIRVTFGLSKVVIYIIAEKERFRCFGELYVVFSVGRKIWKRAFVCQTEIASFSASEERRFPEWRPWRK